MNVKEKFESIKGVEIKIVSDEDFCIYSQRTPKKVDWLWEPYILRGNLTGIVGEGGVGKSYFTSWLAAAISSGGFVPFKPYRFHMERVFLQNGEDDVDSTTLPRLISNGANTNNIEFFTTQLSTPHIQLFLYMKQYNKFDSINQQKFQIF